MKRIMKSLFAALFLSLAFLSPVAALANADKGPQTITILGTTDIHSNIIGFSYENDKATTNNGLARLYSYVKEVREENPNVILIDNGDTIQGNIMTDDIYNKNEDLHPVIAAMNFMKYDSMTLGNHEFNFGPELISRIEDQADFPILAANLSRKDGKKAAEEYTIVKRNGVKIGIIGLTNPNAPRWDGDKVDDFEYESIATACRRVVDEIKDKVDIIVVSAHAGMFAEYDVDGGSDAAEKIIDLCPEVDALLVGHAHITVSETVGDTVVGGARNMGREIVRFDISLDGEGHVSDRSVSVIEAEGYEPDAELISLPVVAEAHQLTRDFISGGAGDQEGLPAGGGIFGQATENFQPVNEINGIPEGKLRDTAVVDLINKVQLMESGADVSAAALFSDQSDIKAGDINYGTIFGIYKYDNTLYRVTVTGEELKNYMEWSAACYNQWVPGDINISFNPDKPGYLYDMFAGVDYQIDLSKPAGERIVNLMFHGEPLSPDQTLTLAVNNYRYSSALKASKLVAGTREWESSNSIRDMLVSYITEQGTISPEVDNNWSITGVDLSSPYRDEIIQKINAGEMEVPYAASLNVDELMAAGAVSN